MITQAMIPAAQSVQARSSNRAPQDKFVCDFVAAWNKVMNLDRFDLTR